METQEMIYKVYEEIADKTLSFGCNLIIYNPTGHAQYIETTDVGNGFSIMSATDGYSVLQEEGDIDEYEIIGHPIHYGYAVDWIEKKFFKLEDRMRGYEIKQELMFIWKDKTKNIEAPENIEALKYLYNLIQ